MPQKCEGFKSQGSELYTEQISWSILINTSDFYLGGNQFEYQPGYQLSFLWLFMVFLTS
jgi:hypothetical protein